MAVSTAEILPEKMSAYRATAQRRAAETRARLQERHARAWAAAQQCAVLLRDRYEAARVVIFGSLLDFERFHAHSDIDLGVWGVAEQDYLRALADLLLVDTEFAVDLVRWEDAPTRLLRVLEEEGRDL